MARPDRLSGHPGEQGHCFAGPFYLHNLRQALHNGLMTPRIPAAAPPDSIDSPVLRSETCVAGSFNPSDLSRRVTHRRQELGLTTEELAQRAGIDPTYLRYFERSADARLSAGTLNLVALVLDTTPTALAGGDVDRAPGRGRAGRHPSLVTLARDQCDAHLAAGGVGRIVFSTERGPVALPVNFEFTAGEVILSTDVSKADLVEKQFSSDSRSIASMRPSVKAGASSLAVQHIAFTILTK